MDIRRYWHACRYLEMEERVKIPEVVPGLSQSVESKESADNGSTCSRNLTVRG